MKTATAPQKIQEIERELARVKSFVIGLAGTDPEGEYRPELAARLLRAEESGSGGIFAIPEEFSRQLSRNASD